MTLGAGTLALKRMQVLQKKDWQVSEVLAKLKKFKISQLEIDDERAEALGFCHPYSGEPQIDETENLIVDNFLIFGMRKDQKKIPGTLFRLQLKAALEQLQVTAPQNKGDLPKKRKPASSKGLSKAMRDTVKDRIKTELMRRTLPSIRLTEVAWNLVSGEIWLFSASQAVFEDFEKLFMESFETPFVVLGPGTLAFDFERYMLGLPIDLTKHLDVVPAGFVPQDSVAFSAETADPEMETAF